MEAPVQSRDPQSKARNLSIHDAKERCFRCLDDYAAHKNPKAAAHAQGLEQMLQLWAKHAGVDARKGMSLDDRLKDYPDLKTTFIGLLELIELRITQALSSHHDQDDPGDVPATVMSNDDNDDIDAEEFLIKQKWRSYKGNLWDAIGAAVDMLIKLTVMVRKASVSVRNSTLAAHFHRPDDYFAGYAKILARNWLKDARRSLTDQLGNSVAVRRRYMLYRMRHEEKINHCRTDFVPAPAKTTLGLLSKREFAPNTPSTPRSTRSANPVFVGTTPSSTNLSQLDRNRLRRPIRNRAAPSGITEGSVSIEETGFSYMFPKPPSLGSMQRYAPCPYCSTPLSAKDLTKDAWRKHLFEDLQPYVCISEKCQETMQFFPSSKQWLRHMEEFHGNDWPRTVHMTTWHCDREHGEEEFKSEGELRNHLVNNHKSLSDAHVSALVRRNWGIGYREAHVCPLCESIPSKIVPLMNEDKASYLFQHIGNHLKALALFSLPSLTTDAAGDGRQSSSGAQFSTSDGLKADFKGNKQAAAEFHDESLEGSLDFHDVRQAHSTAIDSEAIMRKEDSYFLPPDLDAEFAWELPSSDEETYGPDPVLESFKAWHEKSQHSTIELDPGLYTIVWIAPLAIEARAAACVLDREHTGRFPKQHGDDYIHKAGEICGHNVVIATLPVDQEFGRGSAAALASHVKRFFRNLWFGLLVGLAAGLPRLTEPSPRDIRLGDVLVALAEGDSAGVIAYDLGKDISSNGFQILRAGHVLMETDAVVRSALRSIQLQAPNDADLILPYYDKIKNMQHSNGTFADPGQDTDQLYGTDESGRPTIQMRVPRPEERRTRIWYGLIGSGEKLIQNVLIRNELRDRYNIIGLEMEAAGMMNQIPVGVIRGVCDYSDGHKNEEWQPYAAAMAAAYAKVVLAQIGLHKLASTYIPLRRNHDFTGRRTQLDQLERMLFREKRERVAVLGLGGMGKTQIALELAYRVQSMEVAGLTERYSVFWVQAPSMAAFHKNAAEVVQQLNIHCGDNDPKEALRTYLESDRAGHWLLVVDNVDDAAILDGSISQLGGLLDFFPRNAKGRVLITTRQASIAMVVASSAIVQLSSMPFDEAYSLMETLLLDKGQVQDAESTKELLERLTCLPLALAQAAAYMNTSGAPIIRYLEQCRSADQNMANLLNRQLCDEAHHSEAQGAAAAMTWMVSFKAIRETDTNAVRLLSFIRWIGSKAIPISILPLTSSQMDLEDSIDLLCEYGFLSWREDSKTLDMQNLVHLVLRLWLDQESGDLLITEDMAIEHLHKILPSGVYVSRVVWRQCFPHILPLLKDRRLQRNVTVHSICYQTAAFLQKDGRTTEMVDIYESLAAIRKETLTEAHPVRLDSQHQLATAYQINGRIKDAIEVFEHVVAVQKKTLDRKDHSRILSEYALAGAYLEDRRIQNAIEILEHVVAVMKETSDEKDESLLRAEHALGSAYVDNGQLEEATKIFEHVVAVMQETLDETNQSRLTSEHALASVYLDKGQMVEAIKIFEHVVAVRTETLDEKDHSRLLSEHALASAYLDDGQIKNAIEIFEHVVTVRRETLNEKDQSRVASENELARAYRRRDIETI